MIVHFHCGLLISVSYTHRHSCQLCHFFSPMGVSSLQRGKRTHWSGKDFSSAQSVHAPPYKLIISLTLLHAKAGLFFYFFPFFHWWSRQNCKNYQGGCWSYFRSLPLSHIQSITKVFTLLKLLLSYNNIYTQYKYILSCIMQHTYQFECNCETSLKGENKLKLNWCNYLSHQVPFCNNNYKCQSLGIFLY